MKINPIDLSETSCYVNALSKQKQSCHSTTIPSTPSTNCLASSAGSPQLVKQANSSPTSLFNETSTKSNNINNNKYLDIFSYHDKISELISNETNEKTNNKNCNKLKFKLDRRSIYDNNQEMETKANDIELVLVEEDAKKPTTTVYKTEKNIQLKDSTNSKEESKQQTKHERDDFDDLVDLTHRIPKKVNTSQTNGNGYHHQQQQQHHHNTISLGSLKSKTRASLPPLPPLPYSFVKLENSKNSNSNTKLNSSSDNIQPQQLSPSSSSNSSSTHLPIKTTTRLIIPHTSPPNTCPTQPVDTSQTNGCTFRQQQQQQSNCKVLRESTPNVTNRHEMSYCNLKLNGGMSQSNFRKSAPMSHHTLHSASTVMNRKNTVCDSSQLPYLNASNTNRYTCYTASPSTTNTNHCNDSQKENSLSSSNSKNSSSMYLDSNSSQSSNFGSSSSTNFNNKKNFSEQENLRPNYCSGRLKKQYANGVNQNGDVQQEWDQITKIFASLETLLNEVVESTSSRPSPRSDFNECIQPTNCYKNETKTNSKYCTTSKNSNTKQQAYQLNNRKSAYCTTKYNQFPPSSLVKSASSMPYFNASTTNTPHLTCPPLTTKRTSNQENTNSLNRTSTCQTRPTSNLTKTMPNRVDRHQAGLSTPCASSVPLFQITINSKNPNNCEKINDNLTNTTNSNNNNNSGKKKRASTTLAELENLKNSSKNQTEISDFLKRINMGKYELKFISNGFDDINFLNNVITLQDLLQIGVESYDDAFKILNEIKQLPSAIRSLTTDNIKFFRIEDWLSYLNLSEYLENFSNNKINSMKRIRQLWEVELTTALQITLMGHRRRMLASIETNLKQRNDETKRNTNGNLTNGKNTYSQNGTNASLKITSVSSSPYNSVFSKAVNCNGTNSLENLKNSISATSFYSSPIKSVKFADDLKEKPNQSQQQSQDIETSANQDETDQPGQQVCATTNSNNQLVPASNSSPILVDSIFDSTIEPIYSSYSSCLSREENQRVSPKTIWKNDPKLLIRSSCNFIVQYLGSSALTKMGSNQDPVKHTIDRLKNTSKSTPYQSPKVELAVSINGVKLLHHQNKECLWNHDIKHINNVCQDQDDLNYFAFSTQTEPNAYYYCHVFSCKDKELSTQIILTIGQAFDLAYELFCKNNFT